MLASQELISTQAGIAIVLGAEIGTCSDTLLAVIGRSKEAIRAGVFHLLFNVVCVVIGLILIQPLVGTVDWISGDSSPGRNLANGHMLFNIAGVVAFAWFIPYFHWALNALIR